LPAGESAAITEQGSQQGPSLTAHETRIDHRRAMDIGAVASAFTRFWNHDRALRVYEHLGSKGVSKMDWNRVEGNWKQVKGKVKEQWGKLTDDDLNVIGGHRDQLEGKIQERYGIAKDQARKEIDDWYSGQRW
jgi:uncharacterized protein YjbJ (UPF0337 family)